MKTYFAYYNADTEHAFREFRAETPEQALAMARKLYTEKPSKISFEQTPRLSLDEIIITTTNGTISTIWYSEDMLLLLAAHDLLSAAKHALASLQQDGTTKPVEAELAAAIAKAMGESP